MNLQIVKSEMFGDSKCDFYQNDDNDVFMTMNQLAQSLEYASKSGIENIISRNEYLKEPEFSCTHKMWVGMYEQETRIFTEDGIYEVSMLSKRPKARKFRSFVRKHLKSLRKGEMVVVSPSDIKRQELEIKRMNAEARLLNAKTRQAMLVLKSKNGKTLSPQSVELLEVNALEVITGNQIDYRPVVEKTYSAKDIGEQIGVSSQKVGKIANKHNLKTEQYGMMVLDKSPYSTKQVQSFRYNEEGKSRIISAINEEKIKSTSL